MFLNVSPIDLVLKLKQKPVGLFGFPLDDAFLICDIVLHTTESRGHVSTCCTFSCLLSSPAITKNSSYND